ncbi:MAG TPA: hypothetical protein VK826_19320, partial [Bacteroidia bacterium]|nr:hypothetical protein [Bacteroidia bacterium]
VLPPLNYPLFSDKEGANSCLPVVEQISQKIFFIDSSTIPSDYIRGDFLFLVNGGTETLWQTSGRN